MKRNSSHSKICAIDNSQVVSKLTANPTVVCAKCGAQAHDASSLCSPVQMTSSR